MEYDFGQNWERFSVILNKRDYYTARESLKNLISDLDGKTFLDIGCGSGIFAVAANSLGAREVVGMDVNPRCIQVSSNNLIKISKWDSSVGTDNIKFVRKSILSECSDLGEFDVVYGWGVLHHTGRMYDSFSKVVELVKEQGDTVYNGGFDDAFCNEIKTASF